jgi:hypothetical protein
VTNAGKTALMLDTVRLNQDKWKCWYFSTELGRHNAKKRINKHRDCKKWKFNFVDDFPNYYDVLRPDDMNFVDYVEVDAEGNYYKIPAILAGIQKRLRNGVAFVALQKPPSRDDAFGGDQTKAKASLFCAIDPAHPGGVIKIVKGKNWKTSENPRGMKHRFKILDGINVLPTGAWDME